MLKVKRTSSAIGGSGSTTMASTASTPTGAPIPERSRVRRVGIAAVGGAVAIAQSSLLQPLLGVAECVRVDACLKIDAGLGVAARVGIDFNLDHRRLRVPCAMALRITQLAQVREHLG